MNIRSSLIRAKKIEGIPPQITGDDQTEFFQQRQTQDNICQSK